MRLNIEMQKSRSKISIDWESPEFIYIRNISGIFKNLHKNIKMVLKTLFRSKATGLF